MADYLKEQQRKYEDYAENYRKETNDVFRELTRQLILVDTVFLSILPFIFNNERIITDLTIFAKHILAGIFILLGASLIFGIVQFFVDYFFFRKWAKAKQKIAESIYFGEATEKNLSQVVIQKQRDIPGESSTIFVWLQVIFLILAIILFTGLLIQFLFSV